MKILKIGDNLNQDLVSIVSQQILDGRVLVYPTDTVYGIGCAINNIDGVERIFQIKCRSKDKPLSVAFSSLEMVKKYAEIRREEEEYMRAHINEPLTFIVKKKPLVADIVTAGKNTVGVRILNHEFMNRVLEEADTPIITTSANISGEEAPACVGDIKMRVLEKVDLVVDGGPCRVGKPSKVVDLTTGRILR